MSGIAASLIRREATIVSAATTSRTRGDLIIVPGPSGSLGDDLLVRGVAAINGRDTQVASWRPNETWPLPTDSVDGALLRHGQHQLAARTFLGRRVARRWNRVVLIGADTLDGAYGLSVLAGLDLADNCAIAGGEASVVGFSFSESPNREVVERLRQMSSTVRFVARGKVSATRFSNTTGRPCAVSPDPSWGFLAETEIVDERGPAQVRPEDRTTPPVVGINLGVQVMNLHGRERFVTEIQEVVRALRADGVEIVALPHDLRGSQSDSALLSRLIGADAIQSNTSSDPGTRVRAALRRCDVVLSCRMHLTISALSVGIPVVAFGYQGKFEDLLADPDLSSRVDLLRLETLSTSGRHGAGVSASALDALRSRIGQSRMNSDDLRAVRARKTEQLRVLRAAVRHEGDWPPRRSTSDSIGWAVG